MSLGMSIVPPSSKGSKEKKGWDFTQDGLWFAEYERDKLVKRVIDYRATNGIPIGDVNQEILDFNAAKTSNIIPSRKIVTLREKVIKWLNAKLNVKPQYVEDKEADRRAGICANCPNNIQNWTIGEKCGRCVENAKRAIAIILMGRPQHRPLGACSALCHQNKVAVWLNDPPLKDLATNDSLPSFCWRKAENFDGSVNTVKG